MDNSAPHNRFGAFVHATAASLATVRWAQLEVHYFVMIMAGFCPNNQCRFEKQPQQPQ